jgi:hypothetical protein
MIVDDADGSLLVLDWDNLSRVDLTTGAITVVSDSTVGSGPDIEDTFVMALDDDLTTAWLSNTDGGSILRVDLTTGDRVTVSDNVSIGTGAPFTYIYDLTVDVALGRAYVLQNRPSSFGSSSFSPTHLLVVDLASGDRQVMTVDSDSSRSPLGFAQNLIRNPATGVLYVADPAWGGSILAVDPATECKAILSSGQ